MRGQVVTCVFCVACVVLAACGQTMLVGDRQFEMDEKEEALAHFRDLYTQVLERIEPLERPLAEEVLVVFPSRSRIERFSRAGWDKSSDHRIPDIVTKTWEIDLAGFVAQLERRNIFSAVRVVTNVHPADRRPHEFLIWHEFLVGNPPPLVHLAAPGDNHTTQVQIRGDIAFRLWKIESFVKTSQ